VRVLTWNIFHGRSQPSAGRELSASFAAELARWDWDAALLQEVPPWWPALLARACDAEYRAARTSRNAGLRLRRALAVRWPDAIKSNGGGCNAILARQPIGEDHAVRLRIMPERRVAQLARLHDGTCLVNFHGSTHVTLAQRELAKLWETALTFSAGAPLVLGGDLNLRSPRAPCKDVVHVASRDVDHLFARGLTSDGPAKQLDRHIAVGADRLALSDHPPLMATLRASPRDAAATAV
jgi:endonuclease/exonuclease/phosphatase family metal-dependent hydrolase